jgi:hypothetical protein
VTQEKANPLLRAISYSSKPIRHLGRWAIASGIPAVRHRVRSSLHASGKKSSLSSRQWNGPSTNTKWTLTMQLSFLPVAAQYWC